MNPLAVSNLSWKAFAAAGAMIVAVQGARAGAPEPEAARMNVVDPLPLRTACAGVDGDLAGALTRTWDDADKPSAVAVTFRVQHHHVFDVAPESDSPATFHQIRRAVHGLRCDGGDDAAHTVRFVIRFVDREHESHVAAISDVPVDDLPGR